MIISIAMTIATIAGPWLWHRPAPSTPVAQIVAPLQGFKLRQGTEMQVRIHALPSGFPLRHWELKLLRPDGTEQDLAAGEEPVADGIVARLAAETLTPGYPHKLILQVEDQAGSFVSDEVTILVPDPQYTLIPLEPGNLSANFVDALSIDASGTIVAFGGGPSGPYNIDIFLLFASNGEVRRFGIPLGQSPGPKLSRDGHRFFFRALSNLDYYEIDSGTIATGPQTGDSLFDMDSTGRWVAMVSNFDLDPNVGNPGHTSQYFLYDEMDRVARQITHDPETYVSTPCIGVGARSPLITADGQKLVFFTTAALGLAPGDGCHLFSYGLSDVTLRYVRTFPDDTSVDLTRLSDDGRWLSFVDTRQIPPDGVTRDFPALLDLQTNELIEPLGGITEFTSFDSVVTGDGSAVIVSTQADLDPHVGNSDHNLELFAYDRSTDHFTQVSETVAGIGGSPGGCGSYQPVVNADGTVIAFPFALYSVESCHLDGPERNEADDLVLGRVRAVRRRAGNHRPVLTPIGVERVLVNADLSVTLKATDSDSDPVYFFAQEVAAADIPLGSRIEDHHNGSATFAWRPAAEQVGLHQLRVATFDEGGGETVQDVAIVVCGRIVSDANTLGLLAGLYDAEPPVACHEADTNRDGAITAADLISFVGANQVGPNSTSDSFTGPR